MTAKIKLNAASGGGSFSLQAPSSSANNRVMTLPDSADGTILTTTNPKAGNILQVVSTTKTDVFTTSSASFTDVTGMSVDITPSSSSNKVLITVNTSHDVSATCDHYIRLMRDSTAISIGTATPTTGANATWGSNCDSKRGQGATIVFLDSPSTTSSVTYKIQVYANGSTVWVLNTDGDTSRTEWSTTSSITAMEVAA